ncbi:MAG: hypothetical protein GF364_01560 [Candidatus Lokiarchaeota archaeon]|nr:hypothetical protein [Candidatus Lokiarchaeota archaeon]
MELLVPILSGCLSYLSKKIIDIIAERIEERKKENLNNFLETIIEPEVINVTSLSEFVMHYHNNQGQLALKMKAEHPLQVLTDQSRHFDLNIPLEKFPYLDELKKSQPKDFLTIDRDENTHNTSVQVYLKQHVSMYEEEEKVKLLEKDVPHLVHLIVPESDILTKDSIRNTEFDGDNLRIPLEYEERKPEKIAIMSSTQNYIMPEHSKSQYLQPNKPNVVDLPAVKKKFFCIYCGYQYDSVVNLCTNCGRELN